MTAAPLDKKTSLPLVTNVSSGSADLNAKRAVINSALAQDGRRAELPAYSPADLPRVAAQAAALAVARKTLEQEINPVE